jgi:hypothetical protein
MIERWVGGAFALGLWALSVKADIVSASSSPFTFPAVTAVKQGMVVSHPSYFKFLQNPTGARTLTFSWSLPVQSKTQRGAITIYSLRGQAIKIFPVLSPSGMVRWNAAKEGAAGIYIARLVYGSVQQHLRLMLCY